MSPEAERLYQAAQALSADDKLMLSDALAADVPFPDPPFDEEDLAVFRRRSAEYDAGLVTGTPWAEVKRRVREQVEERFRG